MPLQIANPVVVAKVDRLARKTGLSKTALVERAVDVLDRQSSRGEDMARLRKLLQEFDRLPKRHDAFDPLEWDENGLPI